MNVFLHTMQPLEELKALELGGLRLREDTHGGHCLQLINPTLAGEFRHTFQLPTGLTGRLRLEAVNSCRASLEGKRCILHWYRGGPLVARVELDAIRACLASTKEWVAPALLVWETIDQLTLGLLEGGCSYELRRWVASLNHPHRANLDYTVLGAGIWRSDEDLAELSADGRTVLAHARTILSLLEGK